MNGIISINGEVQPTDKACISPLDRGLLFGDNIFEVFVSIQSKVLEIDEHLARLRRSAEMVDLEIPWSNRELSFEIEALVESGRLYLISNTEDILSPYRASKPPE